MRLFNKWIQWAAKRARKGVKSQLNAHNLYILPTSFGWAFGLVLLTIFLSAINYQVSAAFFFTFLLALIALMSAWEAHFNLKGLSVQCLSVEDAHQGEQIQVHLLLSRSQESYAINYFFPNLSAQILEKLSLEDYYITLNLPALKRGCFHLPRITFFSTFPFGLFRVWGYIFLESSYWVYPKNVAHEVTPPLINDDAEAIQYQLGQEEVYELKEVGNPWIQSSRIAWKIAARGQGWFVKTMMSPKGQCWLFRVEETNPIDLEINLQSICYWIEKAEQGGHLYGIEVKGMQTEVAQGPEHLRYCLRQLADY